MAATCDVCGKRPLFGNKVSATGKRALKRRVFSRTRRRFDPNIQPRRVVMNGTSKRLNVCSSCLKGDKVELRA